MVSYFHHFRVGRCPDQVRHGYGPGIGSSWRRSRIAARWRSAVTLTVYARPHAAQTYAPHRRLYRMRAPHWQCTGLSRSGISAPAVSRDAAEPLRGCRLARSKKPRFLWPRLLLGATARSDDNAPAIAPENRRTNRSPLDYSSVDPSPGFFPTAFMPGASSKHFTPVRWLNRSSTS